MTARNDALDKMAHLRRRAYRPVLEAGDGLPSDSKLGGAAFIKVGGRAPRCADCSQPLALAVQLNSAQLPEPLRKEYGVGLIQLFVCSSAGCNASIARLIDHDGEPAATEAGAGQVIRSWSVVDDYPDVAERDAFSIELDAEESEAARDATVAGDKLAGWPAWPGDPDYPSCPECGKKTRLVFQLGERGHLMACPSHKSNLVFRHN